MYISSAVVGNNQDFEQKVRLLRNFVHENVHRLYGEHNRPDTIGFEKLVYGIGWCDQQSRVFMQLAKKQNIKSRLLFLKNEQGASPHSIAEAWDGQRWVIVDCTNDLDLSNKQGRMASAEDIKEDMSILLENKRLKAYGGYWQDPAFLSMYHRTARCVNTKKPVNYQIFHHLPELPKRLFLGLITRIYIFKNRSQFVNSTENLEYFRARICDLTGERKKAERLYRKMLQDKINPGLQDKVRFYLALLLKNLGRHQEAIAVLTDLIGASSNGYRQAQARDFRAYLYKLVDQQGVEQKEFW